jgi:hypothetical protein
MAYNINEVLPAPVIVGDIKDSSVYYKNPHGSSLLFTVIDENRNLIARGVGVNYSETYQNTPVMELNEKFSKEVVMGAMPPGNLTVQTIFYLHLNDMLPNASNLTDPKEYTAIIQLGDKVNANLRGLVINVFTGVNLISQGGNVNAQANLTQNIQFSYRVRMNGLQWAEQNPALKNATADRAAYPADVS